MLIKLKSYIVTLVICLSTISMSLCISETAAGYDYPINEDIELDYEWIRYIVANLSDLIKVDTHGIYQGRYFGGVGDRLAATYISQWMNESTVNLQNRGLAKVYTYPIGNNSYEGENSDQAIIRTSNNKIDILSYELSFSNGTHTATIPNNESYPVPISKFFGRYNVSSKGPQTVELFDYDDFVKWIAGAVTFSCTIMGNINQNLSADFAGEVVYIEDYSQASENETVDTLHLLEFNTDESDDAYYEKIQKVMDSGGAGFILITTNPSFLADIDLGGFGVAVSPYEGMKIKRYLQNNQSVVAFFNTTKTHQGGAFDIYTSPECIGEKKIGLIEESGDQPIFRGPYGVVDTFPNWLVMFLLSSLPKFHDYAGFLFYNKTFTKTHYMMSPTGNRYDKPKAPSYSNYLSRPFMFINGSVNLDSGEPVNIWEWAEPGDLTAEYRIEQKRNDSVESYNVLCEVKGKDQNKTIMISGGHHDFFWGAGASDNAAGVAIMLGILKWLNQTNIIPEYNLTFVSFSGEEVVCRGSGCHVFDKRFASMNENMTYMLNFDFLAHNTSNSTLMLRVTDETLATAFKRTTARTNYNEIFQEKTYELKVKQDNVSNDAHPFFKRYVQGVFNSKDKTDLKIMDMGKERMISDKLDVFESRHRSGADHTRGDSLDNIDFRDLNVTADIALNITRFLILEPPVNQFVDCEFTPFDICGDTWNDSVNITFNVTANRTSWVTVEAAIRNVSTGTALSDNSTWFTVYKNANASGFVTVTLLPNQVNDTYNISVRLFDDKGNLDDSCYQLVNLSPYGKPIADFNYTYSGLLNHTFHFYDQSLPSPGGTITQWSWTFGDGGSSTQQNCNHTYLTQGKKTVTLTVTDSNSLQDTIMKNITVVNKAPTVSFSHSSSVVLSGQTVEFTASAEDIDGSITNYTWDFGDGTYGYDRTVIEHTYEKRGVYSVTLTVTDDCGATNSSTQTKCVIVADAFVDDSYPFDIPSQHKWKALQSGIDDATTRDGILYVFNGDYARSTVENPVTIIGESMEGVKLSPAGGLMPCTGILIQADNVTIRNFNVTNCTVGIKVENRALGNVTVESCKILSCYYGVIIDNSTNCIVQDCVFIGNNIGVYLNDASNTLFRRSTISNAQYGIYLEDSSGNWIGSPPVYDWYPTDCTFTYCDYGIYLYGSDNNFIIGCAINGTPHWEIPETMTTGIYLDTSHQNTISTCYIHGTTDKGVFLSAAAYNKIDHCKIVDNPYGIKLSGSLTAHNLICQNNISCNAFYALYIPSEAGENRIVYNDFIDNGNGLTSQSWDANGRSGQENIWCKSEAPLLTVTADGEGNYWSDYTGEDLNEDGVGDTPYVIASGRVWREDTYPLMRPYGWCADWE